jgi:prophage regulatory protein
MADYFLSDKQVAARYKIDRTTIWRWVRNRTSFPKPIKLSEGCTRWRLADIEAWEQQGRACHG